MGDIDDQAIDALRQQYLTITRNYEALRKRCENPGQLAQLNDDYQTAFRNYLDGQNDLFDKNAAAVTAIVQASAEAKARIDAALHQEQAIVSTLTMITAWVKTGTSLLALVK